MNQEWENDFVSFQTWAMGNGYNKNLSIDRIDNDGNYEPGNCRWATRKVQANNTRQNRIIEFAGVSKTLSQWAEEAGLKVGTLHARLKKGWTVKESITRKVTKP
jgi:hypothetical protein